MRNESADDDRITWSVAWRWLRPRFAGASLILAGILLFAWTASRASSELPPTATEYGLLVVFASALNITGGAMFGRIGKVQPTHARSAVRRLLRVGKDMALAQGLLRAAELDETNESAEVDSHSVDALLGSMSGHLIDAIHDWEDVHKDALQEVLQEDSGVDNRVELR